MPRFLLALVALLLAVSPFSLAAQSRQLYWRELAVDAQLDSLGQLHVRERQRMVFAGDWNGGERVFNTRTGQRLDFHGLQRVDPTGASVALTEGDLSAVDQFSWSSQRTLRWRSRLPSDPPFNDTELTFVLEYSLSKILVPTDSGFTLDHDFAFPDRDGPIHAFSLRLTIDSAWHTPAGFTGVYAADTLYPGRSYVVTIPLTFARPGLAPGVRFGATWIDRIVMLAALAAGLLLMVGALLRRDAALGRWVAPPRVEDVNEAWLQSHVLNQLPEVVGAAWDDRTAAPEVAAVLARLVMEKKLSSDVKRGGWWIFKSDALHLKLLTKRDTLREHERALVDAFFRPGEDTTSTDAVRERYSKSGFNPATVIADRVKGLINVGGGTDTGAPKPSRKVTLALLGGGLAFMVAGGMDDGQDALVAFFAVGLSFAGFVLAASNASAWQARVHRLGPHALRFLVPLGALIGGLVFLLLENPLRVGRPVLGGITLFVLGIANSVFNVAKIRQGPARIALRKRLVAAREYFRRELKRPQPRLRDEWFPYVIAFGLGSHMDHWFRAFGSAAAGGLAHASSSSSFGSSGSSGSSTGSSTSWSGMGGGGGFSGGGSSASFAAAVGVMAAGVSKPSSGSSGGGSSGGGSSGGGGGGGW